MSPEILYLVVYIFGAESNRYGPYTMKQCIEQQTIRGAELNIYYSRLPPGVGMSMAKMDRRGKIGPSRTVFRKDITMKCEFDDGPAGPPLRGTIS